MEQFRLFFQDAPLFAWGIALILAIPTAILVLGEWLERLVRRNSALADFVRNTRNVLVPLISIRLIAEHILGFDSTLLPLRVFETILWLVLLFVILQLLNALVRGSVVSDNRGQDPALPRVWGEALRMVTAVGVLFYVLGALWGVPMDQVFAVLGVGSIVIGFALQDTLSSLVAGLFLAFEKPFVVGHWLRYQQYEGQVIEMNWRAVRLRTRDRDVVVLPNSVLGKDVAINFTLLDPLHAELIRASFSYHHPPNQVKRILLEVALATPGVIENPLPHVRIVQYAYDKFAIDYEIKLFLNDYARTEFIRDEILTRIYYAAQRAALAVPYQTTIFYQRDGALLDRQDNLNERLHEVRQVSFFAALSEAALEQLARGAAIYHFGAEERLIRQGAYFAGLYFIKSGQVALTATDNAGQTHPIVTLNAGEFFGETVLLREQPALFSVTVTADMEALFIRRETLIEVVETQPRLAQEMMRFIEERTKLVERMTGQTIAKNGRNGLYTNGASLL